MNKRMNLYRPPTPGPLRLALVVTLIVGGSLALYRHAPGGRWIAVAAAVLVLVLLAWWRGTFVTTIAWRWLTMMTRRLFRRRPAPAAESAVTSADAWTTVVLKLDSPSSGEDVPIGVIAGYLDRYGVRCRSIRITTVDLDDARRSTWVSLTVGAADNLPALQARSPRIPLRETARTVGRRLADHLREFGWQVHVVDNPITPLPEQVTEGWRAVSDDRGYLAAYRIAVNGELSETLRGVRSAESPERWIVVELTGLPHSPALTAVCALRSAQQPGARAPLPGLTPCWGENVRVLQSVDPLSCTAFQGAGTPVSTELLDSLPWPAARQAVFEAS